MIVREKCQSFGIFLTEMGNKKKTKKLTSSGKVFRERKCPFLLKQSSNKRGNVEKVQVETQTPESDPSDSDSDSQNQCPSTSNTNDDLLNRSASSLKIDQNLDDLEVIDEPNGFILMDTRILCSFLDNKLMCDQCFGKVKTYPKYSTAQGFSVHIYAKCENAKCGFEGKLFGNSNTVKQQTTREGRGGRPPYELNVRMVCYAKEVGKGHSCLETFGRYMDSPNLCPTAYQNQLQIYHSAIQKCANDSVQKAGEEVKEQKGEKITASFDGSWQRRGHSSHNGVVSAISGGKCIDFAVLSNYCKECEVWEKKKGSPEYELWSADHECQINHDGSANAMEAAGAVRIFKRSIEKHGLQYTSYLGDGDSASYKSVCQAEPYGADIKIDKLECVGHVQKRLGGRLRKLKQQYRGKTLGDGKPLGGIGRLTDQKIDLLQNYFGMAIRENCQKGLNIMQQTCWATLYHVSSTDQAPNHHLCPVDSWCGFQTDPASYHHRNGLAPAIVELLEPIYDSLCSSDLLGKCVHGKTQNCNENLNSLIWKFCPKEVFASRTVVEDATALAVCQFNDGSVTVQRLLKELGVEIGQISKKKLYRKDQRRIYLAELKTSDSQKSSRKRLRAVKKGFSDKFSEKEGNMYSPGNH